MKYTGGCHCGNIKFEVEGTVEQVIDCNCSICTKRGALHWFVTRDKLQLSTPEANLSTYTFNKHRIQHRFCARCGCAPFGEGIDPRTGTATAAVNVRCLEGIEIASLKIKPFNGRGL